VRLRVVMAAFAALDGAWAISLEQTFRPTGKVREAASLLIGRDGVEGSGRSAW